MTKVTPRQRAGWQCQTLTALDHIITSGADADLPALVWSIDHTGSITGTPVAHDDDPHATLAAWTEFLDADTTRRYVWGGAVHLRAHATFVLGTLWSVKLAADVPLTTAGVTA